jgi:uncharacterized protein YxjI
MFSIGDDFWMEDDGGERVFRVDGKALRLRKTFHLEEMQGRRLCTIHKRVMHIRDTYGVEMATDQNPALLLAVTVAIDEMADAGK